MDGVAGQQTNQGGAAQVQQQSTARVRKHAQHASGRSPRPGLASAGLCARDAQRLCKGHAPIPQPPQHAFVRASQLAWPTSN